MVSDSVNLIPKQCWARGADPDSRGGGSEMSVYKHFANDRGYEVNCIMSEHGSITAKQAGHPNIFGMDDTPAHFPHRPRSGMLYD